MGNRWMGSGQCHTRFKVTGVFFPVVTECMGLFVPTLEYRFGVEWGIFGWGQGQGHTNNKATEVERPAVTECRSFKK